jgi:putative ubiquitin-RnfH superfamily antitoxin RatB of RatAB toxin-antitoxin module
METDEIVRVTTYLAPADRRKLRQLALDRETTVAEIVRQLILKELAR